LRRTAFVSIVTPAYNAADTLPETARSVFAQTHTDWEWIIVDDGSTDATLALTRDMAQQDSRVRVVALPANTGLPAAVRNRGLSEARGIYIALLDADDAWLPDKLARQLAELEAHPEADAVCTLYEPFGDPTRARLAAALLNHERAPVVHRAEMLRHCPWQTSTLLMRRACYDELGGFDESPELFCGDDYLYFARLLHRYTVRRIPEALVRYRVAPLGASVSAGTLANGSTRGWHLYEALLRHGVLNETEARQKRAALHFEEAKDKLFHLHQPFRAPLFRSIREGGAPMEAWVAFLLCWLPAPALRAALKAGLEAKKRIRS